MSHVSSHPFALRMNDGNKFAVFLFLLVFASFILNTDSALAAVQIGAPAPAFTGKDTDGNTHRLEDYSGKIVVLEWHNHKCPYVAKHYDTGNMQRLQDKAVQSGVIWLTVVSSTAGKQGHTSPEEARNIMQEQGAAATARILDPEGEIGRLYEATTTPHMFVIDENGILVYMGAIDDNSSFRKSTVKKAHNYVTAALESLQNGTDISVPVSAPYGCSVKY